ncbi:MAG: PAS domain S-box protein [Methanolinea sp.]|nr:PAS domain S-box protein [Methanolinea sp.]
MSHPKPYSILYVDDDRDLLFLGKTFLERMGDFSVEVADSAREGLGLLDRKTFDAVISDYQMPSMTGLDLLNALRSRGDKIPFVIFTGKGREEVVIEALNAGADFYIQKGGDPRSQFVELAHKVRQAITRRRAEQAVIESRKRLSDIIDFLPDATFAIDRDGRVITWNRGMEEMTGTSALQVLGKGNFSHGLAFYGEPRPMLVDLVISPDEEFEREKYLYTNRDGTALTGEIVTVGKNGHVHHYWGKASRLIDESGEVVGAIESIRDITERVKAEEQAQVMAQVLDNAPVSVIIHDLEGKFLYANQKTFDLHGFTREEFMARTMRDVDTPESAALIDQRMQDLRETGEASFTVSHFRKDGSTIPLHVYVKLTRFMNQPVVLSIATDLTEHLKKERALQESEEKFRRIVETSHEGIWAMDENFRTTYVNPRMAELLGYTPVEMQGRPIYAFMAREELSDTWSNLRERMTGVPGEYERKFIHRDGSTRIMHVSATPLLDEKGRFRGSFAMLIDITEKRQLEDKFQKEHTELTAAFEQIAATEEELRQMISELNEYQQRLRESEERYRRLVSSIFDAMVMHDGEKIVYANERAIALMGGSDPSALIGKRVLDFVYPDLREDVIARVTRMKEGPMPVMPPLEERFIGLDGTPIDVEVVATAVEEEGKKKFLVIFRDITERRRLQEALIQANRKINILNAITRHDIRNKVAVLAGHISLLKEHSPDTSIVKCATTLENSVQTIQQILDFTQDYQDLGVLGPRWHDVSRILARVGKQFLFGSVTLEIQECKKEIFADPLVEKVFYTIIDNALRYGRTISKIQVRCEEKEGELVIIIEDDGIGISAEDKENIFERGYGKGTGLGLFLAREVLSITGMSIRETGTEGSGARFEITVPRGMWREYV